ncbi:MAG: hypothetical protein LBK61_06585 [Spirochaetaceae bacterium]|jgi:hypothetical protein|nr:hypothetical protein [Spirochaetaceae bacterium]
MNQEQVKEKLESVHKSPVDYTVIFSGKKSQRVNGLYRPMAREIIIHNKNFENEDGSQNENLLMFTAIHELAHHARTAETGDRGIRPHTREFWATFHNLLDTAKELGVYRPEIDAGTQKLIGEARDISVRIAELQRELGRVILAINESRKKNGLCVEDIIERGAQIGRQTAKLAVAAFLMGDTGAGADMQAEAARQRTEAGQEAVIAAAHNGKSVAQAKKAAAPEEPKKLKKPADKTEELALEKRRVERTIESLERRLEEIRKQLDELESGGGT